MKITQNDVDSLAEKLDALSDGEKLALRVLVASQPEPEVSGFGEKPRPSQVSLPFEKIEWVWKAPAGLEAFANSPGTNLLDYEWIAG